MSKQVVIHNYLPARRAVDEGGDIEYKNHWIRTDGNKFWVETKSGQNLGTVRNRAEGKSKIEGIVARGVTSRTFGEGRDASDPSEMDYWNSVPTQQLLEFEKSYRNRPAQIDIWRAIGRKLAERGVMSWKFLR